MSDELKWAGVRVLRPDPNAPDTIKAKARWDATPEEQKQKFIELADWAFNILVKQGEADAEKKS